MRMLLTVDWNLTLLRNRGLSTLYFSTHYPSAMIWLGCTPLDCSMALPLNSPFSDIDKNALEIGVKVFLEGVEMFFK